MSGSIKDLIVRIMVDDDEIKKFQKAGGKSLEFGNAVNKGAMAGAAALGFLALGASTAGDAAADAQSSAQQLQFALDKFPATADTNSAALYRLNSQLALKTQYDDDAYASGQAVLAGFGLTGAQIEKLTPLLGDYAAKTGKDIPTAAADLGKALNGQGKALKVLGINFKDTHDLGGNYGELVDSLTGKIGGYAESQGTTAVGANAIFKNSIGELWEALGQDLLPIMVKVSHAGLDLMNWMQQNSTIVIVLASAIGIIAAAFITIAAGMKVYAAVQAVQTALQWANNAAWLASPVTWIILAIIVVIALIVAAAIWLYNNWDSVTKFLGEAWQNVLKAFQFVGAAISKWWNDFWNGIVGWVKDTFGPVIDFVIGYFGNMQIGFKLVGDAISKQWNDLWSGLGAAFSLVWSGLQTVVKGAWNGIIGVIEGGVNGAIGLINGILRGINGIGGGIGIHLNLIPNVKIPRLYAGGITTGPQVAMIGDNPGGREAVIPLDSAKGRDLLGGNDGPTELSDRTIDKLADAIARKNRNEDRKGAA